MLSARRLLLACLSLLAFAGHTSTSGAATLTLSPPNGGEPIQAQRIGEKLSFPVSINGTWSGSTPQQVGVMVSSTNRVDAEGRIRSSGDGTDAYGTGFEIPSSSWTYRHASWRLPRAGTWYMQVSATACLPDDLCEIFSNIVAIRIAAPGEPTPQPRPSAPRGGFAVTSAKQRRAMRAAWDRVAADRELGPSADVHRWYVTRGAGTTNRYAVACVDHLDELAVFGRTLKRGKDGRWRVLSRLTRHNVESDRSSRTAAAVVPAAAYWRMQAAVRACASTLGVPAFGEEQA
jgi:hypothetical protein